MSDGTIDDFGHPMGLVDFDGEMVGRFAVLAATAIEVLRGGLQ